MSQEPDTKDRAPKTDIWPPPLKNQPELPPLPTPRPKGGLDALVTSAISVACLVLQKILDAFWCSFTGILYLVHIIRPILGLCWLIFGMTGLIYSLMSWKTSYGRIGLTLFIGMIVYIFGSAWIKTLANH